ncbi:ferrous iron transporter B [Evansella cellulosilytica]|uniref:Small GTP-binding protein n=1 Tax=Evansella cellulosilytica (strain ATCC 21833 / DSM 2522 / FERM P-1141 / JCM 9156 / N-4) TaxID=649639 RepID=E6TW88_EVAC2|nr:ferrous iron transporter B [Evansella cellulosilytica]ADU31044.1 small GTP-binding protein [Evansella cellulosilytica DSM 2522]
MECCHEESSQHICRDEKTILLMGNPNVGKSVIFSKLTGRQVLTANYAGTTVSFTKGDLIETKEKVSLIDVPGTYSLNATSEAENVAIQLLNEHVDAIICVLDATNLERNLLLSLDLLKKETPIIFALNLMDVAERQGITIDVQLLEEKLGARVIPTVAVRNIGLYKLIAACKAEISNPTYEGYRFIVTEDSHQQIAQDITMKVEKIENRKPTMLEKLGDWTMVPFPGIPIALLVLILSLAIVVGGGKALRATIFLPFLNEIYIPIMEWIVQRFVSEGIIYSLLVGEFGVLIKAFEWPIALILPYVFLFYIILSTLEDSGYLPRLGVLMDGLLRKIGVQGGTIIPFIMGYGCAVPAIISTRAATTKKERLVVATLVTLAIPCTAQTGAFIALLGDHSMILLLLVFFVSFFVIIVGGFILNKCIKGQVDPLLIEVPNILIPNGKSLFRKISLRTKHFMMEAEIPMIIGIVIAAVVIETGLLNATGEYVKPIVVDWLGLPEEASIALVLGIIRRELGVLPLLELDLTLLQMFVGSVVALLYLPCLSVFAVLMKEFKTKVAILVTLSTIFFAFIIGGLINQAAKMFASLL